MFRTVRTRTYALSSSFSRTKPVAATSHTSVMSRKGSGQKNDWTSQYLREKMLDNIKIKNTDASGIETTGAFLIQNSWGTDWGEDGYIRVAQFNPHETENSWGLFGLLAEGVAPLQAFNQTEQVYDEPQDVGPKTWGPC